ncbi:dipeptide ABC transporter ATP-binding protein [Brevibacillus centrosporus]|uniref:ABC transporter ATP-binding protein n=1 Tax=Brevibacillus centrosporus TaxID=54910 RepID=UPI000F09DFDF|nr:dipeptide ABC transporter ATP-binding protein [Brevibacillus centrosporus]MEC2129052.1 dipeptide ABC transporter ATP-binding protein [Brevibacillus centrosporus]RNB70586.1 dipeptide ABC transporter ATP-binding protein [Brevibacillus centrosporus]GED29280.1 ABC transporter ATP-binding protein [Brevibacillus centrosporus]
MSKSLVVVDGIKKTFPIDSGFLGSKKSVKAVNLVSFEIKEGETFSLVGESGCGKSTTGRLVTRLLTPDEGKIWINQEEISKMNENRLREVRKQVQMVFQDPYASLNPRMKIREVVGEPLVIHTKLSAAEREKIVEEMLDVVGLNSYHADKFAHEFSGGQRQRIGIARALILKPKLIVADEPVSALDVSIQSQILNLLKDLQEEFQLTYLFISHDLSVVEHISDKIGVMYLGSLVESGPKESIFANPQHPYTKALLSSVPIPDPRAKRERIILQGDVPSPVNPPSGCLFHTRCPYSMDMCKSTVPRLREIEVGGHFVACHL